MGCTQSVTDAQSNPQDPFDNKDETTTPVKRSTSLPLPRSSSSPYRINKKHSSSNNSQSPNKRMIVARAKIKRLGSGSWTSDRKNKIRYAAYVLEKKEHVKYKITHKYNWNFD